MLDTDNELLEKDLLELWGKQKSNSGIISRYLTAAVHTRYRDREISNSRRCKFPYYVRRAR
jgi:hypothetical protein